MNNLKNVSSGSNEPVEEIERVRKVLADKADVSQTTYHRAETIIEKAPEELKEKVRSGETSINYAYKLQCTVHV